MDPQMDTFLREIFYLSSPLILASVMTLVNQITNGVEKAKILTDKVGKRVM